VGGVATPSLSFWAVLGVGERKERKRKKEGKTKWCPSRGGGWEGGGGGGGEGSGRGGGSRGGGGGVGGGSGGWGGWGVSRGGGLSSKQLDKPRNGKGRKAGRVGKGQCCVDCFTATSLTGWGGRGLDEPAPKPFSNFTFSTGRRNQKRNIPSSATSDKHKLTNKNGGGSGGGWGVVVVAPSPTGSIGQGGGEKPDQKPKKTGKKKKKK